MTFDPARPRYKLKFDGQEYELLGDLALIEGIEYGFQESIVQVATRSADMGLTDTAKLLSLALTAAGEKITARQVGEIIFNKLGVNSEDFKLLRLHLYAFLRISLEPPEQREQAAKRMGELLGKAPSPSPGKSTKKSV